MILRVFCATHTFLKRPAFSSVPKAPRDWIIRIKPSQSVPPGSDAKKHPYPLELKSPPSFLRFRLFVELYAI
jgi:hypothetical protein